jgi:HSP20 family protein
VVLVPVRLRGHRLAWLRGPGQDMEVSVAKGILTICAEGHEDIQGQHRSEFRYGTFTRHIDLPVTADANDIKANYHWGILQVSIGLRGEDEAGRRIPVQTAAP